MFSRYLTSQIRRFSQSKILLCQEPKPATYRKKIGSREIVGFGANGEPTYVDSSTFPYPAVRFREITPNIKALKEKEKGNWKSLSIDEKKCLYRVSFCQTLVEVDAPTGDWKDIIGSALLLLSGGIFLHLVTSYLVDNKLPPSFSLESQQAQLKRVIDLRMNPITGLSSKWDYDKKRWKD